MELDDNNSNDLSNIEDSQLIRNLPSKNDAISSGLIASFSFSDGKSTKALFDYMTMYSKFTIDFQKQCDSYSDFISEALEDTSDNNDFIGLTEMYDEFRIWYEDIFGNNKHPSKMEFKKYLKKKYPKNLIGIELKGFRFKVKTDKKTSEQLTPSISIIPGY